MHLLQSLFVLLDYGDRITFNPTSDGTIRRIDRHTFKLPEDDLCTRAAEMLKQHSANRSLGATITLEKFIPPGAGLGAGSSNAATVLLALNKLWQTNLSLETLAEIGLKLGADIPVFIYGRASWAEGVGEQLSPVELDWISDKQYFVVLIPPVSVSTVDIFSHPELKRNHAPVGMQDFIAGDCINTLQPLVVALFPQVGQCVDYLNQFGQARMSGTGAAVFASFADEQQARSVVSGAPDGVIGFVSKICHPEPVHIALGIQATGTQPLSN